MSFEPDHQGILWFQHATGGSVHGFNAVELAKSQERWSRIAAAEAQHLPAPPLPPLPMDEIAAQIRSGRLQPAVRPSTTQMVELSQERIAQLMAEDRPETVAEKRARLMAELAELGDENPEDVSASSPSAGADGADTPTPRRGAKAATGR